MIVRMNTKYKVGDKIRMMRNYLRMGRNHVGMEGVITEVRCYGGRFVNHYPTHYVVKFEKYKIPHIYYISDIDECCELIKENKDEDNQ